MNKMKTVMVVILCLLFIWSFLEVMDEVPFTKDARCKDYMMSHSNLTSYQGQNYYVENNRCHEYLSGGWFVAHWSIPMEKLEE